MRVEVVRFLQALETEERARGLLTIKNLLHDLRARRLDAARVERRLERAAALWSQNQPGLAASTAYSRTRLTSELCAAQPVSSRSSPSRVVTAPDLQENIDTHLAGWCSEFDLVTGEMVEDLKDLTHLAKGKIPSERPFAWVTQSAEVESERARLSEPSALAATLRNKLGLLHSTGQEPLLEIVYPNEEASPAELRPPTALDGSPYDVFRCSSDRSDGWGCAVDLAGCGQGLPEAIHRPVPFTKDFVVKLLGVPGSRGPDFNYADVSANHEVVDAPPVYRRLLDEIENINAARSSGPITHT